MFKKVLPFVLLGLMFAVSLYAYTMLPAQVASHWNAAGVADGYSSRTFGAFFLPILAGVLYFFLKYVPRLDPRYKNIEEFQGRYTEFLIVFLVFFGYLHILTLLWNLGYKFDFVTYFLPAFGGLFYEVGRLVEVAKPNWTIGVRTPWTLSSESVWRGTHALAGKLFKVLGVITLACMVIPTYAFFVFIPITLAVTITVFVYSYILYHREQKNKNQK